MAAEPDAAITDPVVPKQEPFEDQYSSSTISTPEADGLDGPVPQETVPIKRKGGRKPIYATSEERKQRNRQAQAAFRERRTEYIKQLENTIKHHEDTLQNLQQSHRTAADECLMLRYKNSLLERILLEKGIDVQTELRQKGGSGMPPGHQARRSTGYASPVQRAAMNRLQQNRRSAQIPPIQPVNPTSQAAGEGVFSSSPSLQPTPPSQSSSPSASKSPGFVVQGGMASPAPDLQTQPMQYQPRPMPQPRPKSFPPRPTQARPMVSQTPFSEGQQTHAAPLQPQPPSQNYYPPTFQKHYDQLGKLSHQEYGSQIDMIDEYDADDAETDNFIPNFRIPTSEPTTSMAMEVSPVTAQSATSDPGGTGTHGFDPFDPMLDADPFGLTASMHFPTPYGGFDQGQARR